MLSNEATMDGLARKRQHGARGERGRLPGQDVVELELQLELRVSFDSPDDRVHRLESFECV